MKSIQIPRKVATVTRKKFDKKENSVYFVYKHVSFFRISNI